MGEGDDDAFPIAPDVAPWAHLGLREEAAVFESASQNARVLTEGWVEHALFCPNCGAQPMARFAANRPVADFLCDTCREEYELKSQKARLGARVMDGAWATMQARLQAENNPNLLVMRYDAGRAAVTDLIVVPKQFFTPEVIERRKPLAASARRAGWVGCNILLGEVPEAGKVRLVREGVLTPKAEVLARFRETLFLRRAGAGTRGWLIEVLKCAERLGAEVFTLDEMYGFEGRLAGALPGEQQRASEDQAAAAGVAGCGAGGVPGGRAVPAGAAGGVRRCVWVVSATVLGRVKGARSAPASPPLTHPPRGG